MVLIQRPTIQPRPTADKSPPKSKPKLITREGQRLNRHQMTEQNQQLQQHPEHSSNQTYDPHDGNNKRIERRIPKEK